VENPVFIIERYICYGWKAVDVPNINLDLLICFDDSILRLPVNKIVARKQNFVLLGGVTRQKRKVYIYVLWILYT